MARESIVLSDTEIKDITQRTKRPEQKKQLRALMIDFRERADGSLCIFRHTIMPAINDSNDDSCKMDLSKI